MTATLNIADIATLSAVAPLLTGPCLDYEEHVLAVSKRARSLVSHYTNQGLDTPGARLLVMRALWNAMAMHRHGDTVEGSDRQAELAFAPLFRHQQWLSANDFGFVYESLLNEDRAERGAYYSPASITKVVVAEALRPRLAGLMTSEDVYAFNVLDPACGSGAMLIEATRQLAEHLHRIWLSDRHEWPSLEAGTFPDRALACRLVAERCISGSDIDPIACEVARLALQSLGSSWGARADAIDIRASDALLSSPARRPHVVVMNPPYLGGLKISTVLGIDYLSQLQATYGKGGTADISAYFLRTAFEWLRTGGTIGLVATNTIAQGDTRVFGLKHVVRAGGRIYRAQKNVPWPGDAKVCVSVVHIQKTDSDTTPMPEVYCQLECSRAEIRQRFTLMQDAITAALESIHEKQAACISYNDLLEQVRVRFPDATLTEIETAAASLIEQGRALQCTHTEHDDAGRPTKRKTPAKKTTRAAKGAKR